MRKIGFIFFISVFVLSGYTKESIEFEKIFDLEIPQLVSPVSDYSRQPFFLKFENDSSNQLLIFIPTYNDETFFNFTNKWLTIHLEVETGEYTIEEGNKGLFANTLPIENGRPVLEGFSVNLQESQSFDKAVLSPSGTNIAGVIFTQNNQPFQPNFDELFLWKQNPLELMFESKPFNNIFEIQFSISGDFFYGRGIGLNKAGEFVNDKEFRSILEVIMIELNRNETVEANGDIAFTSDEQYFVTERNETPTLVDTRTDDNILTYTMPVRMVGAVFSPDNQKLYLTGKDNNLYIFNASLPATLDEWMLMED